MTDKLAANWPYKPGLEYSPPARGTWTIAHTPLLVPESVEVYVCPESCLRGVSLSAAEFGGLGTRFSLVVVEEEDWIRSRMEPLFIEGVSELLEQRLARDGKYPPVCFVFNSCMHQFMDTNMGLVFRRLAERFPDVLFVEGNMNCTMRTLQTHFEAATGRALYKGLLPVGDAHRRAGPAPVPAVNVIGNYFALSERSELVELLRFAGFRVNDLPRVKTYDEYQQMADAVLDFYTHPFGKEACADLEKRLGIPFLEVPYCWDFEEIERTERALLERAVSYRNRNGASGEEPTPILRTGLLTPYREEAVAALRDTAAALTGWSVTVDASATPRPFGLAALLEEYGCSVTTVYAEGCGPLEADAKVRWETLAQEHGHKAVTLPLIDWRMRTVSRRADGPVVAIGQKAAYYIDTPHFVNLIYQSGLLGFRGITELCELLVDAVAQEKDLEAVLSEKAVGSAEAVREGLARSPAGTGVLSPPAERGTGPADQASLYAVNYSSDLSGVCSALYELGGLLVMHDASGCNSTYATHDEPRWYGSDSLIFISGLRELDAVLGNDEKYISDICEAAAETHPKFIAVFGSPIAAMTGTDFKGVARVIEKRTGIPTLHFDTSGMHSYQAGARQAFAALSERFVEAPGEKAPSDRLRVNLLGLTPLDFSVVGNAEALREWCDAEGFDVLSSWAMNTTLDDIARAGEADVNLVLSSTALDAAKLLHRRFGTPYVIGLPAGKDACAEVARLLRLAAETGVDQTLFAAPAAAPEEKPTLIIGEPVFANSIRFSLERQDPGTPVRVLCPLEDGCGLLRDGDLIAHDEPSIRRALAEAGRVIADPLYRPLCPRGTPFTDLPSESYSGRMYRDRIPVFLGPDGSFEQV